MPSLARRSSVRARIDRVRRRRQSRTPRPSAIRRRPFDAQRPRMTERPQNNACRVNAATENLAALVPVTAAIVAGLALGKVCAAVSASADRMSSTSTIATSFAKSILRSAITDSCAGLQRVGDKAMHPSAFAPGTAANRNSRLDGAAVRPKFLRYHVRHTVGRSAPVRKNIRQLPASDNQPQPPNRPVRAPV